MDLLYELAEHIFGFMESAPPFPGFVLYMLAGAVPVVLLHELGHAAIAVVLLDDDVELTVGNVGEIADVRLGRVRASINAVSLPNQPSGTASFDDAEAGASDVLWIALAGPAASLVGVVLSGALLGAVDGDGVLHGLLWAATAVGIVCVLNLIPFELQDRKDGPVMRSDGWLALDALRVLHTLG